jgi:hypothetical protein
MPPSNTPSFSVFKCGSMVKRVTMSAAFIFAMVAPTWGQTPAPTPGLKAKRVHWHKYVNKEYGFSLWYPDTYRPTDAGDICKDNDYRRYLLCLERRDNSDALVWVTIIIAAPFHVYPGSGDVMPSRQRIGHHVFYCGMVGSMGVGYGDNCILNLKGKALEFQFDLPDGPNSNSSEETRGLIPKMLKTLRTF